jgi:hypothetical protein
VKYFGGYPFLWHFFVDVVHLSCSGLFGYRKALVLLDEFVAMLILLSTPKSSILSFCKSFMINFADSISSNSLWSCFTRDTQFKHSEALRSQFFRLYLIGLATFVLIAAAIYAW